MFTSITLSTGTTVRIPIFDNASVTDPEVLSRANAVLRDYDSGYNLVYSRVTDEELLELGCMFLGISSTEGVSINIEVERPPAPYTSNNGHEVMLLYWCYNQSTNKYVLCMPFSYSTSVITAQATGAFGLGLSGQVAVSSRYYNSYNPNPLQGGTYTDFWAYAAHAKEVGSFGYKTANVRSGGVYTLDVIASSDRNDIQFASNARDETSVYNNIDNYIEHNPDSGVDYDDSPDTWEDPYGNIISQPGGGDGDPSVDPSQIEKATIPELPSLSAVDAGMITMFYCTNAQLQALASYLWSNIYDLETNFVKLFSNPMDCIIGLGIVPVMPTLSGGANVKFGNINTNISMSKLASQFVEKDMGSVAVPKWIGSFLDFAPYVKLSLYLPYIGYRDIDPNDVVGESIHVVYHVDCLTGGCCAMVEASKKGLLYSFNGSCIADVPLTAINYSGAIQNAVSAVGSLATTAVGIATGAAPIAAAGAAMSAKNLVGGLSDAANTAMNSKPSVQRSGNMGGAAGIMSYQRPMLIIERPRMCVPNHLNQFAGNTLYVTRKLSTVKGYTVISLINLSGISATREEKRELETLLKQGVIF